MYALHDDVQHYLGCENYTKLNMFPDKLNGVKVAKLYTLIFLMYRSITIMDINHVQKSINTSSGQVRHIIRQWKHSMERLSRCE